MATELCKFLTSKYGHIIKKQSAGSGHGPNTYPCRLLYQFPRNSSPRIPAPGGNDIQVEANPVTPLYTTHAQGHITKLYETSYICKVTSARLHLQGYRLLKLFAMQLTTWSVFAHAPICAQEVWHRHGNTLSSLEWERFDVLCVQAQHALSVFDSHRARLTVTRF